LLFFTAARFAGARFTGRLDRFAAARERDDVLRLALRPVRVVRVARIVSALTEPLCHRRPIFAFAAVLLYFFTLVLLSALHDLLIRALVPPRLLA
jgi:hypothetical protein